MLLNDSDPLWMKFRHMHIAELLTTIHAEYKEFLEKHKESAALGKAVADGRGVDLDKVSDRVRDGHTGERKVGNIGFATLRGGMVVGDHSVIFASDDERVEITHKAADRGLFAKGAIRAALWRNVGRNAATAGLEAG